jgi:hypothetical protein
MKHISYIKCSLYLFIGVAVTMSFSSCGLTSGFQDGRSVGKKNREITVGMTFTQKGDFSEPEPTTSDFKSTYISNLGYPAFEFGARYGITDKMDFNFRLNTISMTSVGLKYQLLGDKISKFALASGLNCEFALVASGQIIQVPIFASFHPSEDFSLYMSPHYRLILNPNLSETQNMNQLGFNAGILMGRKNKFGVEVGYYNIGSESSAFLIGFGVKYLIKQKN